MFQLVLAIGTIQVFNVSKSLTPLNVMLNTSRGLTGGETGKLIKIFSRCGTEKGNYSQVAVKFFFLPKNCIHLYIAIRITEIAQILQTAVCPVKMGKIYSESGDKLSVLSLTFKSYSLKINDPYFADDLTILEMPTCGYKKVAYRKS